MNQNEFEEKFKKGFEQLDAAQQVELLYRYSMALLPWIIYDDDDKDYLDEYLLGVLRTVDSMAYLSYALEEERKGNRNALASARRAISIAIAIASARARAIEIASARANASDSDSDRAIEIARAIAIKIARAIASASAIAIDIASIRARARARRAIAIKIARRASAISIAIAIASDSTTLFDMFIREIDVVKKGEGKSAFHALFESESYVRRWDVFLSFLHKRKAEYWGLLFREIMENNFTQDIGQLKNRVNVPKEIYADGLATATRYIVRMQYQAVRLNEARLIILGDKGAGKTSLARKLEDVDAEMPKESESTEGVELTIWKPELKGLGEEDKLRVRVWDFAGHVVTHAIHKFFLAERCVYVLVYNGRVEESNQISYWLTTVESYAPKSEIIILVNTRDEHKVELEINKWKSRYNIIKDFEFNIKTDTQAMLEFQKYLGTHIAENPQWRTQKIAESSLKIKRELEDKFENAEESQGQEHIKMDEFEKIAEDCEETDTKNVLKELHALGIALWYENIPSCELLILNPEWISSAVYKVINWARDKGRSKVKKDELREIFQGEKRYREEDYDFIWDLLISFELAYTFEEQRKEVLIIPQLLPLDQPPNEYMPTFDISESLMLEYVFEERLLPNIISRFIVRHHELIPPKNKNTHFVWRRGVILKKEIVTALVLEDEEKRKITMKVTGAGDRTGFLDELRETINSIIREFAGNKPDMMYKVNEYGKEPQWERVGDILKNAKHNIPLIENETNRRIPSENIIKNNSIRRDTLVAGRDINIYLDSSIDNSTHIIIKDCTINLRGNLNELAEVFGKTGQSELEKEAKELSERLEEFEELQENADQLDPKKLRVNPKVNRLKRFMTKLKSPEVAKVLNATREGIEIANNLATAFNNFCNLTGIG